MSRPYSIWKLGKGVPRSDLGIWHSIMLCKTTSVHPAVKELACADEYYAKYSINLKMHTIPLWTKRIPIFAIFILVTGRSTMVTHSRSHFQHTMQPSKGTCREYARKVKYFCTKWKIVTIQNHMPDSLLN